MVVGPVVELIPPVISVNLVATPASTRINCSFRVLSGELPKGLMPMAYPENFSEGVPYAVLLVELIYGVDLSEAKITQNLDAVPTLFANVVTLKLQVVLTPEMLLRLPSTGTEALVYTEDAEV